MNRYLLLGVAGWLTLASGSAGAQGWRKDSTDLAVLNRRLQGQVLDYTANHGKDRRIWSRSLTQKRDLYVYLPPGFDASKKYPIVLLLHGFAEDEQSLLKVIPYLDNAIAKGVMPPTIIAAPDGSISGEPSLQQPGSFFINSKAGEFEDFVLTDVWDFLLRNYPIRPERDAHVLAGVSMGGAAAFSLGIRHRNAFGVAVGLYPALNLRWVDDEDRYMKDFDPYHWGWRESLDRRREVIASFYGGAVKLRIGHFIEPLFGMGEPALIEMSRHNPIELVDRTKLRDGELKMFVAYGGRDEFNIDAQVESFLYLCKHRGITVHVAFEPEGRHNWATAQRLLPDLIGWLGQQLKSLPEERPQTQARK